MYYGLLIFFQEYMYCNCSMGFFFFPPCTLRRPIRAEETPFLFLLLTGGKKNDTSLWVVRRRQRAFTWLMYRRHDSCIGDMTHTSLWVVRRQRAFIQITWKAYCITKEGEKKRNKWSTGFCAARWRGGSCKKALVLVGLFWYITGLFWYGISRSLWTNDRPLLSYHRFLLK